MAKETQASSAPKTEKDDIDVPEFNEQQLEFLNSFFNKAFASRMREHDSKQEKRHSELLDKISSTLPVASKKTDVDTKEKEEEKEHPEFTKMKKKMEEYEKERLDRQVKDLAAAKNKILEDAISNAGITGTKQKMLQAYLEHSGLIVQEDMETLQFNSEDGKTDLKSGIKKFLKTEMGKEFLPPVGIKGSGETKVQSTMYSNGDKNKSLEEIQNEIIAKAFQTEEFDL